jgi:hypothetical protein
MGRRKKILDAKANKETKPVSGLSGHEQETVITFNKSEPIAEIFTYEHRWQKRMEEGFHLTSKYDNGFGGRAYEIDKHRISLPRIPRTGAKRTMTPEHLAKLAEGRKRAKE